MIMSSRNQMLIYYRQNGFTKVKGSIEKAKKELHLQLRILTFPITATADGPKHFDAT